MLQIRRYKHQDNATAKELNYAGLAQMRPDVNWKGIKVADGDYDDIEGTYINNRGEFLVGTMSEEVEGALKGEVVVTGAVKKLDESTAEIKRIRVKPELQRKGYGETMLKELMLAARKMGYKRIRIDTMTTNTRAQQLFKKAGFKNPIPGKIDEYDVFFYFMDLK